MITEKRINKILKELEKGIYGRVTVRDTIVGKRARLSTRQLKFNLSQEAVEAYTQRSNGELIPAYEAMLDITALMILDPDYYPGVVMEPRNAFDCCRVVFDNGYSSYFEVKDLVVAKVNKFDRVVLLRRRGKL